MSYMPIVTPSAPKINIPALPNFSTGKPGLTQRLVSVDVYRGFVMLLMMAEVLSFRQVSEAIPGSAFWRFLRFHQEHVPWVGCSLHDLIQPSFSFLVGVVLPFSLASRLAKGATFKALLKHALIRSLTLIGLGIFIRSLKAEQTNFIFTDTLAQIGLGYTFLFLLGFYSKRIQITTLVLILIGYWAAFALYPVPGSTFNYALTDVTPDWEYNLKGFAAHWNKNVNVAWSFDRWFLNLFPKESVFNFNKGGYVTLNFIPTLGTMILGLLAGRVLQSNLLNPGMIIKRFVLIGSFLVVAGFILHLAGINPIVKRIWTPSWVLFSGGLCYLFLSFFYGVIDVLNKQKWGFFLLVIGANSIAAYLIAHGIDTFIAESLSIHLGKNYHQIFGAPYSTLVEGVLILLLEWLILYWLFKKKIFLKI